MVWNRREGFTHNAELNEDKTEMLISKIQTLDKDDVLSYIVKVGLTANEVFDIISGYMGDRHHFPSKETI